MFSGSQNKIQFQSPIPINSNQLSIQNENIKSMDLFLHPPFGNADTQASHVPEADA